MRPLQRDLYWYRKVVPKVLAMLQLQSAMSLSIPFTLRGLDRQNLHL